MSAPCTLFEATRLSLGEHDIRSVEQSGAGPLLKKTGRPVAIGREKLCYSAARPSLKEIQMDQLKRWIEASSRFLFALAALIGAILALIKTLH